jgi:hypothetical protein
MTSSNHHHCQVLFFLIYNNSNRKADKEMTCGSSIFAYLVFGPGRASIEGIARPTKIAAWRGPGAKLDVQG